MGILAPIRDDMLETCPRSVLKCRFFFHLLAFAECETCIEIRNTSLKIPKGSKFYILCYLTL